MAWVEEGLEGALIAVPLLWVGTPPLGRAARNSSEGTVKKTKALTNH